MINGCFSQVCQRSAPGGTCHNATTLSLRRFSRGSFCDRTLPPLLQPFSYSFLKIFF